MDGWIGRTVGGGGERMNVSWRNVIRWPPGLTAAPLRMTPRCLKKCVNVCLFVCGGWGCLVHVGVFSHPWLLIDAVEISQRSA